MLTLDEFHTFLRENACLDSEDVADTWYAMKAAVKAAKEYRQAVEDEDSYSCEEVLVMFKALDKLDGKESTEEEE